MDRFKLTAIPAMRMITSLIVTAPIFAFSVASAQEMAVPAERAVVSAKVVSLQEVNKHTHVFKVRFEVTGVDGGSGIKVGDFFEGDAEDDDPNGALIRPVPRLGEKGRWRLFGRDNINWGVDGNWANLEPFPARDGVDSPIRLAHAEAVGTMIKQVWNAEAGNRFKLLESYLASEDPYVAAYAARLIGGDAFMPGCGFTDKGPTLEKLIARPELSPAAIFFLDAPVCEAQGESWSRSDRRAALLTKTIGRCKTEDDASALGEIVRNVKYLDTKVCLALLEATQHATDLDFTGFIVAAGDVAKTSGERQRTFEMMTKLLSESEKRSVRSAALTSIYRLGKLDTAQLRLLREIRLKASERILQRDLDDLISHASG